MSQQPQAATDLSAKLAAIIQPMLNDSAKTQNTQNILQFTEISNQLSRIENKLQVIEALVTSSKKTTKAKVESVPLAASAEGTAGAEIVPIKFVNNQPVYFRQQYSDKTEEYRTKYLTVNAKASMESDQSYLASLKTVKGIDKPEAEKVKAEAKFVWNYILNVKNEANDALVKSFKAGFEEDKLAYANSQKQMQLTVESTTPK